jgi:hypothetical protein
MAALKRRILGDRTILRLAQAQLQQIWIIANNHFAGLPLFHLPRRPAKDKVSFGAGTSCCEECDGLARRIGECIPV